MVQSRIEIAKPDILDLFESAEQSVFKRSGIEKILSEHRTFWRLTQSTTVRQFIQFLIDRGRLRQVELQFPNRKEIRFVWDNASDYEIVQSLRSRGYFTHFTALHLHQLTLQLPKTIYLNYEQPAKGGSTGKLEQQRIDYAFRNACRVSRNIADFDGKRVCILNGKATGQRGVVLVDDEFGRQISMTDIERTLIDCVVRPVYAGGVHNVMTAFAEAAGRVSVNKLAATLSTLEYLYPYHQAIGFYLEHSGAYTTKQISIIDRFEKTFDFYLAHQMGETDYSEEWRLYYPAGL